MHKKSVVVSDQGQDATKRALSVKFMRGLITVLFGGLLQQDLSPGLLDDTFLGD